jgi:hypothetical protein
MSDVSSGDDAVGPDINEEPIESESFPEDAKETEEEPSDTLPLDQVFGILKNQRRRYVLQYLHDTDGQVTLSDVAEQIAAWENDKDIRQISSGERKRVYVGLYQCHLPKMDAVGVISFNKPRGTIDLGPNSEPLYRYLDTDDEADEPPWHRYSVALSLAGALVLGIALLLRPMTTLPVVDIAVVSSILAFSAYSVANVGWLRRHGPEADDDEN